MTDPTISRPRAGLLAFDDIDISSIWSQAAQLIGLGVYLSGGAALIADMEVEARELLIPRVEPAQGPISYSLLQEYNFEAGLPTIDVLEERGGYYRPESISGRQSLLWSRIYETGSPASALALLNASLYSEHEIVRVAAAAALTPLVEGSWPYLESILVDGCLSTDDTPRLLAAHSLSILSPQHPALTALNPPDTEEGPSELTRTSITIHGTFARLRSDWYKPGSAFHRYLKRRVSADLYSGDDYFRWDGRYSDASRQFGANDLKRWLRKHKVRSLDTVFAHSHGGNLVLTALSKGVKARLIVLMSVPAREPPTKRVGLDFRECGSYRLAPFPIRLGDLR